MKRQYTKKQITEAIAYWEKQLNTRNYKQLGEAVSSGSKMYQVIWTFSNAANNPELKLFTSKELATEYAEGKITDDNDNTSYRIREYTVVK